MELSKYIDLDESQNNRRKLYQKLKSMKIGVVQKPLFCKIVMGEVIAQEKECIVRYAKHFKYAY